MAVQQIGTRLVRSFGNGDNLKKVVTEVVNGKTFTNVFDAKDNLIKQRVKAFSEEMVGDKFVKTKTTVTEHCHEIFKDITDSVYKTIDDVKKFVGGRKTHYIDAGYEDSTDFLKKESVRYFNRANSHKGVKTTYSDGLRYARREYDNVLSYNDKGLPMPNTLSRAAVKGLSLKEMRKWHLKNHPQRPYTYYPGYEFLDEPIKSIKLNDLDKLL